VNAGQGAQTREVSAPAATHGDRRDSERFHIECSATVSVLGKGQKRELEPERLEDIGLGGARFSLGEPLEVGTRLRLHLHLPSPRGGVTTLRFEGVVARATHDPRCEVAMQFRRSGRFLRNG